jgi:nucleoside-diphosphate-sugar epimerase
MKRVIVTGASGFIGWHCLPLLASEDYEIHAIDLNLQSGNLVGVTWHQIDLLNFDQTSQLIAELRPTHLLHLAWFVQPGKYLTSLNNITWVQASLQLFQTFRSHGGERAVGAGTCFEYDLRYGYCSEQLTPLNPVTLYGVCKNSLQNILSEFARQTGLSAAWGRIFFLYGPHEHPKRLVPSVICSLLRGEPAYCTDGRQIRDFLYVIDVARAFVSLLDCNVSGPVNIASGNPISLKNIISKIATKINRGDLIRLGALSRPLGEPHLIVADTSRINHEVDWKPKYDLNQGLDETVRWWEDQLSKKKNEDKK